MNPDSENFDSLRRLLALKRHEIPPPGYFDRFPRDVMARIRAGEKGGEIGLELSWPQRLLSLFDVKPVFAGAFGAALCAMVISGVLASEQTPALVGESGSGPLVAGAPQPQPAPDGVTYANFSGPTTNLFDQFDLKPQTASERLIFTPNNNN